MILTTTKEEANRLKYELTKYFKQKLKLELSQEKTYVTDLRNTGIRFLGFIIKAEKKRKTPDSKTWTDNLVGKPYPDMERLNGKIEKLKSEIRKIKTFKEPTTKAAKIQEINAIIMGIAQYISPSICSNAFSIIDRKINNTAFAVWKKMYPKSYNQMQIPLNELCNLPHRHKDYTSKTFAIQVEGNWFGLTYAFITHSQHEPRAFDQKITPYSDEGRKRFLQQCKNRKSLPCDRPSVNSPEDIALSIYARGKKWKKNFEYFMNREYAYNRDKGKCKCCGKYFDNSVIRHCHHVDNKLPPEKINKVQNLIWVCRDCHYMIHNSPIYNVDIKTERKILKYREKLKK